MIQLSRQLKFQLALCGFLLLMWFSLVPHTLAAVVENNDTEIKIQLGFNGTVKLGCWQPFTVTTPDRIEPKKFELTVFDGDDTPITYTGSLHSIGSGLNQHQGHFKLGRRYGVAELKLLDNHDLVVAQTSMPLRRSPELEILDATRTFILTVEPKEVLASSLKNTSLVGGRDNGAAIISLANPDSLPLDWFCYEGIDNVMLVTSDLEQIRSVSPAQWAALDRWVQNGGRLIFSAASNAPKLLAENKPLNRFAPGKFSQVIDLNSSSKLDTFTKSGTLLKRDSSPLPIATFAEIDGQVVIAQNEHALIVRSPRGFGEIVFVTFDLDRSQTVEWTGFSNLLQRLQLVVELEQAAQDQTTNARSGSVSHYGYDDLIGQLRVPLDKFRGVQFIAFNWIAVLIGLYILCIGPGDYFFLKKITRKMELTWITFPLITFLFAGLAIWISQSTRPQTLQVNQLELIDIDAKTNFVRGTAWSNVYSPSAGERQISLATDNALGFKIQSDLLSWQGLPGAGLGGMQTTLNSGILKTGYRHELGNTLTPLVDARLDSELHHKSHSQLVDVPLYVSSTKPLLAQYNATYPTSIRSTLKFSNRTGRLEGTLINGLQMPLKNVRLLFGNYAYLLKQPQLQSGETIDVMTEMKERTVRSWLTRRTQLADDETKSQNSPWDQTESQVDRIAEVLMFYKAAGANKYTGLSHAYQNFVDLSDHLELGQAILVGEIEGVGTPLVIDGKTIGPEYDSKVSLVRILLPVTNE